MTLRAEAAIQRPRGSRHGQGTLHPCGREEREIDYHFNQLDNWEMNMVDFKAGEYPRTQSKAQNQMFPDKHSGSTLTPRCAAGLSSLDGQRHQSLGSIASGEGPERAQGREGPVFSAQQEARVCLTRARPLAREQWEPLRGTQYPTHCSWCCLLQSTSGPDAGLSRTRAAKDPRMRGCGDARLSSISIRATVRRWEDWWGWQAGIQSPTPV